MPQRRKPIVKEADWPADKSIQVLRQQASELQKFRGRSFRDAEHDEDAWRQFTHNVIVHAFGEGSNNLREFTNATWAGEHNVMGVSDQQSQVNFQLRIERYAATLHSSIKELEVMSPTPDSTDTKGNRPTQQGLLVLISHSGKDEKLALALIELLRAALGLMPYQIRCSSVDGYRLPAGVNTEAHLRAEVDAARIVIGLITPNSLASPYVLFELGARWGSGSPTVPLLAGVAPDSLRGPLSGMNALSSDSEPQLHQFVEDIAKLLSLPVQSPASYSRYVSQVSSESRSKPVDGTVSRPAITEQKRQLGTRIWFSHVPISGGGTDSRGRFAGTVIGLPSPERYKVVLYALTDKWYVQPVISEPYTDLDGGGNWENWTHLGFRYSALVVLRTFMPSYTLDSLPDIGGDVIAKAEVPAYEGANPLP